MTKLEILERFLMASACAVILGVLIFQDPLVSPAKPNLAADISQALPVASVSEVADSNLQPLLYDRSGGTTVAAASSAGADEKNPHLAAAAAGAFDLSSNLTSLFLSDEHDRWPIASITKLITAVVATDMFRADEVITVPSQFPFSYNPSSTPVDSGQKYTAHDLLTIMLLASNNQAAESLARAAGDYPAFIRAMNTRAREWGMTNTYFADPTGFSASNQSTIRDLAVMAAHIYREYPALFQLTTVARAEVTELESHKIRSIININQFAGRADFLGGKTGYTNESNGNLLSVFSFKNHAIVFIVLGTDDRFGQTEALYRWVTTHFSPSP